MIKIDSVGQERWLYTNAGPSNKGGIEYCITLDGLGGVYVGGWFWKFYNVSQIALAKLNISGDTLWIYIYPHQPISPWGDATRGIVADMSGNIYLAGEICASPWNDDIVVMKFASAQGLVGEVMGNDLVARNLRPAIFKGGIEFLPLEDCGLKVYDVLWQDGCKSEASAW